MLDFLQLTLSSEAECGAIAQLGERIVRNDEVVGSIPTSSTTISTTCRLEPPFSAVENPV